MKLSIAAAVLAASSLYSVASAAAGTAEFVQTWKENGLQRYRFRFQDVSTDNFGQEFLSAFRSYGGITSNWQAWFDAKQGWTFDDSEIQGCVGLDIIAAGIRFVTGQTPAETGLQVVFNQQGGC